MISIFSEKRPFSSNLVVLLYFMMENDIFENVYPAYTGLTDFDNLRMSSIRDTGFWRDDIEQKNGQSREGSYRSTTYTFKHTL